MPRSHNKKPDGKEATLPTLVSKMEMTEEKFRGVVLDKMRVCNLSGLDAILALCNMPLSENSFMMQVKFTAARFCATVGTSNEEKPQDDMQKLLDDLDKSFKQDAPRIRSIRERVVTFDDPKTIEGTVEQ